MQLKSKLFRTFSKIMIFIKLYIRIGKDVKYSNIFRTCYFQKKKSIVSDEGFVHLKKTYQ